MAANPYQTPRGQSDTDSHSVLGIIVWWVGAAVLTGLAFVGTSITLGVLLNMLFP